MVRWRPFLAAALVVALAACGGSSKKEPPDTTPPAVANPQNAGLARGDKLLVRFSEPVHAAAAYAVNVLDAGGATLPLASARLADDSLEVSALVPLPVPGPVEVRVENVADAAGNVLARGSAFFRVSGWVDMGYARQPGYGPQVFPQMEAARVAGVTQVIWIGGRAWNDGAGWTEAPPAYSQSLAADGDLLLHTAWNGVEVAFSALDRGAASSLGAGPVARPSAGSLAGCRAPGTRRAVYAWMEQVASPSTHDEVKVAAWDAGVWTSLGTLGGDDGVTIWVPSAVCAPSGTAFVAFSRFPCPTGDCLVVLRRAPADTGWTEAHRIAFGYTPSLALDGERLAVAYPSTSNDVRVERQGAQGWESLAPLSTGSSNLATEPSLIAGAGGVLHVAWSERPVYPVSEPEKGRIYVAARRGAEWVILGKGPVNDEVPVAAARAPRLALGDDGVLVVAYYEWAAGDPVNGDFRIRVKRFAE